MGKDSTWTLERAMTTLKMWSQSISIVTNISIWPKNVGRRKKRRWESVLNITKKGILPRNEKIKDSRGIRRWRQQQEKKETGFWRRSWVGMVQVISLVNSQNKYVIPNWQSNVERELNVQANVKTKNGKNLKVKALVDSRCTHIRIDKQLVKNKKIQTKPINF